MPAPGWRPLALLLGGSGVLHLVRPQIYEGIVPRRLGSARAWVYGSGVAELVCAAALSHRRTRKTGAVASAALLAVVYPANVQMAVTAIRSPRASAAYRVGSLARLPLQFPLIGWALRLAREAGAE